MTSMSSVATEGRVSGSRLVTQNMLLGLDSGWMMGRGAARRKHKREKPQPFSDSAKENLDQDQQSTWISLVLSALILRHCAGNRQEHNK